MGANGSWVRDCTFNVRISASIQDGSKGWHMPALDCSLECGDAPRTPQNVHVGACANEEPDDLDVALLCCCADRIAKFSSAATVHICPPAQEQLDYGNQALLRRCVQRSSVRVTHEVDISADSQESYDHLGVACEGCLI